MMRLVYHLNGVKSISLPRSTLGYILVISIVHVYIVCFPSSSQLMNVVHFSHFEWCNITRN